MVGVAAVASEEAEIVAGNKGDSVAGVGLLVDSAGVALYRACEPGGVDELVVGIDVEGFVVPAVETIQLEADVGAAAIEGVGLPDVLVIGFASIGKTTEEGACVRATIKAWSSAGGRAPAGGIAAEGLQAWRGGVAEDEGRLAKVGAVGGGVATAGVIGRVSAGVVCPIGSTADAWC